MRHKNGYNSTLTFPNIFVSNVHK